MTTRKFYNTENRFITNSFFPKNFIHLRDFIGFPIRLGRPSSSKLDVDVPGGGGGGGGGA
jgi:hypothetical protein